MNSDREAAEGAAGPSAWYELDGLQRAGIQLGISSTDIGESTFLSGLPAWPEGPGEDAAAGSVPAPVHGYSFSCWLRLRPAAQGESYTLFSATDGVRRLDWTLTRYPQAEQPLGSGAAASGPVPRYVLRVSMTYHRHGPVSINCCTGIQQESTRKGSASDGSSNRTDEPHVLTPGRWHFIAVSHRFQPEKTASMLLKGLAGVGLMRAPNEGSRLQVVLDGALAYSGNAHYPKLEATALLARGAAVGGAQARPCVAVSIGAPASLATASSAETGGSAAAPAGTAPFTGRLSAAALLGCCVPLDGLQALHAHGPTAQWPLPVRPATAAARPQQLGAAFQGAAQLESALPWLIFALRSPSAGMAGQTRPELFGRSIRGQLSFNLNHTHNTSGVLSLPGQANTSTVFNGVVRIRRRSGSGDDEGAVDTLPAAASSSAEETPGPVTASYEQDQAALHSGRTRRRSEDEASDRDSVRDDSEAGADDAPLLPCCRAGDAIVASRLLGPTAFVLAAGHVTAVLPADEEARMAERAAMTARTALAMDTHAAGLVTGQSTAAIPQVQWTVLQDGFRPTSGHTPAAAASEPQLTSLAQGYGPHGGPCATTVPSQPVHDAVRQPGVEATSAWQAYQSHTAADGVPQAQGAGSLVGSTDQPATASPDACPPPHWLASMWAMQASGDKKKLMVKAAVVSSSAAATVKANDAPAALTQAASASSSATVTTPAPEEATVAEQPRQEGQEGVESGTTVLPSVTLSPSDVDAGAQSTVTSALGFTRSEADVLHIRAGNMQRARTGTEASDGAAAPGAPRTAGVSRVRLDTAALETPASVSGAADTSLVSSNLQVISSPGQLGLSPEPKAPAPGHWPAGLSEVVRPQAGEEPETDGLDNDAIAGHDHDDHEEVDHVSDLPTGRQQQPKSAEPLATWTVDVVQPLVRTRGVLTLFEDGLVFEPSSPAEDSAAGSNTKPPPAAPAPWANRKAYLSTILPQATRRSIALSALVSMERRSHRLRAVGLELFYSGHSTRPAQPGRQPHTGPSSGPGTTATAHAGTPSSSTFFVFHTPTDRDAFATTVLKRHPPLLAPYLSSTAAVRDAAAVVAARWRAGTVSNLEYLLALNRLAGRSMHDLAQYPVLPWVLKDYDSDMLDLDDAGVYRDLAWPIGAQTPERRLKLRAKYKELQSQFEEAPKGRKGKSSSGAAKDVGGKQGGQLDGTAAGGGSTASSSPNGQASGRTLEEDQLFFGPPFHFGSLYMKPGTVAWYLMRVEPYTSLHLAVSDGRFDRADRLFHSISEAYKGATSSDSDVRELVPEAYLSVDGSWLANANGYILGTRQDGATVGHVVLPPWAKGQPKLFAATMRAALESPIVTSKLHLWVDLVFGHKTGMGSRCAVAAVNSYHGLMHARFIDSEALTAAARAEEEAAAKERKTAADKRAAARRMSRTSSFFRRARASSAAAGAGAGSATGGKAGGQEDDMDLDMPPRPGKLGTIQMRIETFRDEFGVLPTQLFVKDGHGGPGQVGVSTTEADGAAVASTASAASTGSSSASGAAHAPPTPVLVRSKSKSLSRRRSTVVMVGSSSNAAGGSGAGGAGGANARPRPVYGINGPGGFRFGRGLSSASLSGRARAGSNARRPSMGATSVASSGRRRGSTASSVADPDMSGILNCTSRTGALSVIDAFGYGDPMTLAALSSGSSVADDGTASHFGGQFNTALQISALSGASDGTGLSLGPSSEDNVISAASAIASTVGQAALPCAHDTAASDDLACNDPSADINAACPGIDMQGLRVHALMGFSRGHAITGVCCSSCEAVGARPVREASYLSNDGDGGDDRIPAGNAMVDERGAVLSEGTAVDVDEAASLPQAEAGLSGAAAMPVPPAAAALPVAVVSASHGPVASQLSMPPSLSPELSSAASCVMRKVLELAIPALQAHEAGQHVDAPITIDGRRLGMDAYMSTWPIHIGIDATEGCLVFTKVGTGGMGQGLGSTYVMGQAAVAPASGPGRRDGTVLQYGPVAYRRLSPTATVSLMPTYGEGSQTFVRPVCLAVEPRVHPGLAAGAAGLWALTPSSVRAVAESSNHSKRQPSWLRPGLVLPGSGAVDPAVRALLTSAAGDWLAVGMSNATVQLLKLHARPVKRASRQAALQQKGSGDGGSAGTAATATAAHLPSDSTVVRLTAWRVLSVAGALARYGCTAQVGTMLAVAVHTSMDLVAAAVSLRPLDTGGSGAGRGQDGTARAGAGPATANSTIASTARGAVVIWNATSGRTVGCILWH